MYLNRHRPAGAALSNSQSGHLGLHLSMLPSHAAFEATVQSHREKASDSTPLLVSQTSLSAMHLVCDGHTVGVNLPGCPPFSSQRRGSAVRL